MAGLGASYSGTGGTSTAGRGVVAGAGDPRRSTPTGTTGADGDAIRRALQQAVGQATASGPAASSTGPTTNTAAPNPTSQAAIDAMMSRAGGDMGAAKALDAGIQDIRSRAGLGIARENELNQVMSGMSNSSKVGSDSQELARAQGADINRLTRDITVGRERDRDSLYQAAANIGLAQGDQQLREVDSARTQHRQDQVAAYEARDAYMSNLTTILNILNQRNGVL